MNLTLSEVLELTGGKIINDPTPEISISGVATLDSATPGEINKETGWYDTIDQVGIVEIGDRVDIGANTTIDRARFGRTVIGDGTLGKYCIMCAQSGIAGSTHVGDYVTIAAQCGITGHIKIADKVVVAARSGVMNSLDEGKTYWGAPAVPYGEAARQCAAMRKLPEVFKELRALKAKAEEIQELINQAIAEQA